MINPCEPVWLPPLFPVRPWTNSTYELLYRVFHHDFIEVPARYLDYQVRIFNQIEDGHEVTFWHLTSRFDKDAGCRLPELERSERLPWARPIIENSQDPEILAWDFIEGNGEIRTYVWLRNYDYVVIMKQLDHQDRYLLTAFWVNYPSRRRQLQKKFEQRQP